MTTSNDGHDYDRRRRHGGGGGDDYHLMTTLPATTLQSHHSSCVSFLPHLYRSVTAVISSE